MLIETLASSDGQFHVGISENLNSKNLDTNDILKIANSLSDSVLTLQFLNPTMIVNEMHLLSASQNALNAMKGGYMIARSLDVEIAVYASAQHQIGRALDLVGVKAALPTLAVVCIDEDKQKITDCLNKIAERIGESSSPMFPISPQKIKSLMSIYEITELELQQFTDSKDAEERKEALSRCVVSRVSQVSLVS